MNCQFNTGRGPCRHEALPPSIVCLLHVDVDAKRAWNNDQKVAFEDFMQTLSRASVDSKTPLDLSSIFIPEDCEVQIPQSYGLELHGGLIFSPGIFKGCVFKGQVNVDNVQFAKGFDLSECQFHAGANISLAHTVDLDISRSTFHAEDGHYHFNCPGSLSLTGSIFLSSVTNLTCTVNGTPLARGNSLCLNGARKTRNVGRPPDD
jgi:hypothetical protein